MKEIYRPTCTDPKQALAGCFPPTLANVITSFTMVTPSQPALLAMPCWPAWAASSHPWPRAQRVCVRTPEVGFAPHIQWGTAGPCFQHVQPSFLSGQITLWNLTSPCLLAGAVEQWSPWDHRKYICAVKSPWDPRGSRMSNNLGFLFYFFLLHGNKSLSLPSGVFFMPFF